MNIGILHHSKVLQKRYLKWILDLISHFKGCLDTPELVLHWIWTFLTYQHCFIICCCFRGDPRWCTWYLSRAGAWRHCWRVRRSIRVSRWLSKCPQCHLFFQRFFQPNQNKVDHPREEHAEPDWLPAKFTPGQGKSLLFLDGNGWVATEYLINCQITYNSPIVRFTYCKKEKGHYVNSVAHGVKMECTKRKSHACKARNIWHECTLTIQF